MRAARSRSAPINMADDDDVVSVEPEPPMRVSATCTLMVFLCVLGFLCVVMGGVAWLLYQTPHARLVVMFFCTGGVLLLTAFLAFVARCLYVQAGCTAGVEYV